MKDTDTKSREYNERKSWEKKTEARFIESGTPATKTRERNDDEGEGNDLEATKLTKEVICFLSLVMP